MDHVDINKNSPLLRAFLFPAKFSSNWGHFWGRGEGCQLDFCWKKTTTKNIISKISLKIYQFPNTKWQEARKIYAIFLSRLATPDLPTLEERDRFLRASRDFRRLYTNYGNIADKAGTECSSIIGSSKSSVRFRFNLFNFLFNFNSY